MSHCYPSFRKVLTKENLLNNHWKTIHFEHYFLVAYRPEFDPNSSLCTCQLLWLANFSNSQQQIVSPSKHASVYLLIYHLFALNLITIYCLQDILFRLVNSFLVTVLSDSIVTYKVSLVYYPSCTALSGVQYLP